MNLEEFKKQLDEWTSSEEVTYEFIQASMINTASDISSDSKWWNLLKSTLENKYDFMYSFLILLHRGHKLDPQIFPAATDSRFIRNKVVKSARLTHREFQPLDFLL